MTRSPACPSQPSGREGRKPPPARRESIGAAVAEVITRRAGGGFRPSCPEGWDGHAGERVIAALRDPRTTVTATS